MNGCSWRLRSMQCGMQERDAKLESYDVEAVLNFAEHVLLNAARLWTEIPSDTKQRLQSVLFPKKGDF